MQSDLQVGGCLECKRKANINRPDNNGLVKLNEQRLVPVLWVKFCKH